MREAIVDELRAANPSLGCPIHCVGVCRLIEDDTVVTWMLISKRKLLPRLGHGVGWKLYGWCGAQL